MWVKNRLVVLVILLFGSFINTSSYSNQLSEIKNFERVFNKALSFKQKSSDSVRVYMGEALEIAKDEGSLKKQLITVIEQIVNETRAGYYSEAIYFCNMADSITKKGADTLRTDILLYTGAVYQAMGLTSEALKLYVEALDDIGENDFITKSRLFHFIASAYDDMGNIEKCKEYARLSIRCAQQVDSKPHEFNACIILSNTFYRADSIQKYFKLCMEICENDPALQYEKMTLQNNIALFEKAIGRLDQSRTAYLSAISIAKRKGYLTALSNLYNNYAYLLMEQQKYDSAGIILNQALSILRQKEDLNMEGTVYDSYGDYYKKIGDFQNALLYKDTAYRKKHQFRSRQRVQESMFLSSVFETEKHKREIIEKESKLNRMRSILFGSIALLLAFVGLIIYFYQKSAHNRTKLDKLSKEKKLDVANALLEGQDTERRRLARDLHDGVSAQIGALRMKIDAYFETEEKYTEVVDSISEIRNNIRSLSHKMLPAQIEEVGLIKSLEHIFSSVNSSKEINVVLDTNIVNRLNQKLEINLYYLIYELINNAIKHSQGSRVNVQLFGDNGSISLSVEDDGIGFKHQVVQKGLGLKNIEYRVEHLGGTVMIDSEINAGTVFMIEIPAKR